ncbi:MAG: hypothetical protein K2M98_08645 [Muribaculum sp.]|nr:hypothetical protein [Muribaculum sp.]
MDYLQIPVTKFADNCTIPRPSMTQLLKGRNKKVSDEVIAKIHKAYPMLNISWLLFGEGSMVNDSNIQFSEPQNDSIPQLFDTNFPDLEQETLNSISKNTVSEKLSEKKSATQNSILTPTPPSAGLKFESATNTTISNITPTTNPQSKHVINIMVFYSDNSFETFVPQNRIR